MARMAQVKMERVNQYVNTRYTSVCVGKGLCHVCCSKLPHPRKLHVLCHDYSIYCSTPQLDTTAICRHKVNLIPPRLKKKGDALFTTSLGASAAKEPGALARNLELAELLEEHGAKPSEVQLLCATLHALGP